MVLALGVASNAGYFIEGGSRAWEWWRAIGPPHAAGLTASAGSWGHAAGSGFGTPASDAAAVMAPISDRPSRLTALLFPLLGGRILSGDGFYVAWGSFSGPLKQLISACKGISWLGFGLVWAGLAIAIRRWWIGRRHGGARTCAGRSCGIAVVVLGLQMVMYGMMRVAPYAHYFTGACGVYILLAWFAAEAAGGRGWAGVALLIAYGLRSACSRPAAWWTSTAPAAAAIISAPRWPGRSKSHAISETSPAAADVVSDIPQYREHIHGLFTLRRLLGIA